MTVVSCNLLHCTSEAAYDQLLRASSQPGSLTIAGHVMMGSDEKDKERERQGAMFHDGYAKVRVGLSGTRRHCKFAVMHRIASIILTRDSAVDIFSFLLQRPRYPVLHDTPQKWLSALHMPDSYRKYFEDAGYLDLDSVSARTPGLTHTLRCTVVIILHSLPCHPFLSPCQITRGDGLTPAALDALHIAHPLHRYGITLYSIDMIPVISIHSICE